MAKIIGNVTATPNPRPDWNQTDETKADYIKNKPFDDVDAALSLVSANPVQNQVITHEISALVTDISETNAAVAKAQETANTAGQLATNVNQRLSILEQSGVGGGLSAAQIEALYGLLKIAAYTEDATAAHTAFLDAFGYVPEEPF